MRILTLLGYIKEGNKMWRKKCVQEKKSELSEIFFCFHFFPQVAPIFFFTTTVTKSSRVSWTHQFSFRESESARRVRRLYEESLTYETELWLTGDRNDNLTTRCEETQHTNVSQNLCNICATLLPHADSAWAQVKIVANLHISSQFVVASSRSPVRCYLYTLRIPS